MRPLKNIKYEEMPKNHKKVSGWINRHSAEDSKNAAAAPWNEDVGSKLCKVHFEFEKPKLRWEAVESQNLPRHKESSSVKPDSWAARQTAACSRRYLGSGRSRAVAVVKVTIRGWGMWDKLKSSGNMVQMVYVWGLFWARKIEYMRLMLPQILTWTSSNHSDRLSNCECRLSIIVSPFDNLCKLVPLSSLSTSMLPKPLMMAHTFPA